MARLTTPAIGGGYSVESEMLPEAINRLGEFEQMQQDIATQQEQLSTELEALRLAGKKSSVKFKELMGKKLMNSYLLSTLQARGL